jgi:alpha-L-fucosidase
VLDSSDQITVQLLWPSNINCISLQEELSEGQACSQFTVSLIDKNGKLIKSIDGTTIGTKRLLTFSTVKVQTILVKIKEQKAPVKLAEIGLYLLDEKLIEKK